MYFCVEDACLKQNNLQTNNVMEWNMRYSYTSPLSLHNPLVQVSFRPKFLFMLTKTGPNPVRGSTFAFVLHTSKTKHHPAQSVQDG